MIIQRYSKLYTLTLKLTLVPFYGDNPLLLCLDILRKLMEGCTVIVGDVICAPVFRTTRYRTVRHFEKAAISRDQLHLGFFRSEVLQYSGPQAFTGRSRREQFYEELVAFNENSTNVEEDLKTITSIPGKNTPRNIVLVLV